jgi:hypothetical protein
MAVSWKLALASSFRRSLYPPATFDMVAIMYIEKRKYLRINSIRLFCHVDFEGQDALQVFTLPIFWG